MILSKQDKPCPSPATLGGHFSNLYTRLVQTLGLIPRTRGRSRPSEGHTAAAGGQTPFVAHLHLAGAPRPARGE